MRVMWVKPTSLGFYFNPTTLLPDSSRFCGPRRVGTDHMVLMYLLARRALFFLLAACIN